MNCVKMRLSAMHDIIRFGKSLSDPVLLRMLNLLREGELCSCEVEEALCMRAQTARSRLDKLVRLGVVRVRQRERWLAYSIDEQFTDLVETIFEVFSNEATFDQHLQKDQKALRQALRSRIEGWCLDQRPMSESRSIRRQETTEGKLDLFPDDMLCEVLTLKVGSGSRQHRYVSPA